MSCRHLTDLQCESTVPSVSAVLSSLLLFPLVPVSDFYDLVGSRKRNPLLPSTFFLSTLSIDLPLETVTRIFLFDQVQGVSARTGEETRGMGRT